MKREVAGVVTLFFVLTLVSAFAFGASTAKDADTEVRLEDGPCVTTAGVFANMPDEIRPTFKAAHVRWQGKDYAACWSMVDERTVYVVDESGDAGALPKSAFKDDVAA